MDIVTFLYYLFGITSTSYILHLGYYLVSASIYDIWQLRRTHSYAKVQLENSQVYQPSVTVLVPAHNEEKVIARCLDSVIASTYPDVTIIAVDDASTDATAAVLRDYARHNPQVRLRIIRKRHNVGKGAALNYALKRYVRTELVMTLDADSILSPLAIEKAVSYFINPEVAGVAANVQIINEHTTLSLLQKFEHMLGYRTKKAYSLTNCEYVIGGVASTYRVSAMRAVKFYDTDTLTEDISVSMKIIAKGNRAHRILYGSDVVAMTEAVSTLGALFKQRYRWKYGSLQNIFKHRHLIGSSHADFTAMLTIYRMPTSVISELILLLLPLSWAYIIYLVIAHGGYSLILGAYLTVTFYMFLTLWHDEHIPRREQFYLSLYLPIIYIIFFIMDVVQVTAVIRCCMHLTQLTKQKDVGSTWVSPPRIGSQIALGTLERKRT
jgi:cellulose synthase/poly-beta-1,6-N-acetylglucosamine synthase-like glycosyltransferase